MTETLYVITTDCTDPVHNLALEAVLMEQVPDNTVILYLWQNDNTVVIGKNQNIRKECRLAAAKRDGVRIVRRSSGGGAVFHDRGNLNFTFLTADAVYSVQRQTKILCTALRKLGIDAEVSGRNDILVSGKKVSGNAYAHRGGHSLHHGTLLVCSDLSRMTEYLNGDTEKLKARGVDSVRGRVANLREFQPDLTIPDVRDALIRATEEEYGCPAAIMSEPAGDLLVEKIHQYGSEEWIMGKDLPCDLRLEKRFDWGRICLELRISDRTIRDVSVWSDSMGPDRIDTIRKTLRGCRFAKKEMIARLETAGGDRILKDVIGMIKEQEYGYD